MYAITQFGYMVFVNVYTDACIYIHYLNHFLKVCLVFGYI